MLGSKYPASNDHFEKSIKQTEKWSRIIFLVIAKIAVQFIILPTSVGSFIVYATTDSGGDSFILPLPMWWVENKKAKRNHFHRFCHLKSVLKFIVDFFWLPKLRFPFDIKNPIGYLAAVSLQYAFFAYASSAVACLLSLGVASFLIIISENKDIIGLLRSFDKNAKNKQKRPDILRKQISEFIEMHSAMNKLSEYFLANLTQLITFSNNLIFLPFTDKLICFHT